MACLRQTARVLYDSLPVLRNSSDPLVRLLKLRPGAWSDSIKCQLFLKPLYETMPEYTALSYVWGSGHDGELWVNDRLTRVTANLHTALRYLRDQHQSTLLWVDAICIDQSNIEERNDQVAHMSAIYKQAAVVVAWLGEAENSSDLAMEHLKIEREVVVYSRGFNLQSDLSKSLHSFWERPYWTRVWVVQEMACSKRLVFQCGHNQVDGDKVDEYRQVAMPHVAHAAATVREGSESARESPFWKFHDCLDIVFKYKTGTAAHVLWTLRDAAPLKSIEPLDKVYGLLKLFPEEFRTWFPPNYDIEFPVLSAKLMDVYQNLYGNLNLLCEFQPLWYNNELDNCPSWVLDVRYVWKDTGTVQNRSYVDGEGNQRKPRAKILNRSLHVRGSILSEVDVVLGPFEVTRRALSSNFQKYGQLLEKKNSFAEMMNIASRVLRMRFPEKEGHPKETVLKMLAGKKWGTDLRDGWSYTSSQVWDGVAGVDSANGMNGLETFGIAFEFLFARLQQRCFFTTREGYIGLGPPCLQRGDLVFAAHGCRMLLALREAPRGTKDSTSYRFIGPICTDDFTETIDCFDGTRIERGLEIV